MHGRDSLSLVQASAVCAFLRAHFDARETTSRWKVSDAIFVSPRRDELSSYLEASVLGDRNASQSCGDALGKASGFQQSQALASNSPIGHRPLHTERSRSINIAPPRMRTLALEKCVESSTQNMPVYENMGTSNVSPAGRGDGDALDASCVCCRVDLTT